MSFTVCSLLGPTRSRFWRFLVDFRFRVVLSISNKADRPHSNLHKSHKNGPNPPKFPFSYLPMVGLSVRCFLSFRFHHSRSRSASFQTFPIDFSFLQGLITKVLDGEIVMGFGAYVIVTICHRPGAGTGYCE